VLELRDINKAFGDTPVLVNVSFTVERGEVVALTGPNGSGKSTLLRCLVGWDTPDSGEVLFEGGAYQDRLPAVRAAVALALGVGDEFADLTVREHLEFMARAHGDDSPDTTIDEVLAELGLRELQQRFPFTLSQGQRRRLGLASCFVRPHRLLILDEPEQNLDVQGRHWLAAKLSAERKAGVGVLMACHDGALVAKVADSEVELTGDIIFDEVNFNDVSFDTDADPD
jgi:ABC-type multidrug transport system ATPase subunit